MRQNPDYESTLYYLCANHIIHSLLIAKLHSYPPTLLESRSMASFRKLSNQTYYFMSAIHRQLLDKNPGLMFQTGALEKQTNTFGAIWTSPNDFLVKPLCYKERQVEVKFPSGETVTAITWVTDLCNV